MHSSATQSVPGSPGAAAGRAGRRGGSTSRVGDSGAGARHLECPSWGDVGAATASGGGCGGHRARGSKAEGPTMEPEISSVNWAGLFKA